MHDRLWCVVTLVIVIFWPNTTTFGRDLRLPESRGFLLYRTNSISQRPCTCSSTISCSCCETVTLLYSKIQKTLCSNFIYQRNGLNVDISLNADTIKTTTVAVYRPFKLCSAVPGSRYSSLCVNVLELNQFSRSLTVCVRHEIVSKTQEWRIDYTCVSISTELPRVGNNMMASMMMTTSAMTVGTTMKATSSMTMATAAPSTMMTTAAPPMTMTSATPPMTMMTSMASSSSSGGMSPVSTSGGQMGSMPPSPPPNGGSGTPPSMGIEPARKRRYASTQISSMSPCPAPEGQMGSIPSASASGLASGMPSMAIEGARKRRYTPHNKFYKIFINNRHNRRARIVNDKIEIPNLHSEDSNISKINGPTAISNLTVISNLPVNMATSISTKRFPVLTEVTLQSNERPVAFDAEVLYDRTQYFPSRIPPVVAKALEDKSIINPYVYPMKQTSDKFSSNSEADIVIFPN